MAKLLYMLDTNTVSYIIKGMPAEITNNLKKVSMTNICISAITEAELLTGLAKLPNAKNLHKAVHEFFIRVDILPWDTHCSKFYAQLRYECERRGKPLGNLDMLIAAHSLTVNAILITNDKAFYNVEELLVLKNWSI